MIHLVLIISLLCFELTTGLYLSSLPNPMRITAYDCTRIHTPYYYSIHDNSSCNHPPPGVLKTVKTTGILIEVPRSKTTRGFKCSTIMTESELYCEQSGSTSPVIRSDPHRGPIYHGMEVSQCLDLMEGKSVTFMGKVLPYHPSGSSVLKVGNLLNDNGGCTDWGEYIKVKEYNIQFKYVPIKLNRDSSGKPGNVSDYYGLVYRSFGNSVYRSDEGVVMIIESMESAEEASQRLYAGDAKEIFYSEGDIMLYAEEHNAAILLKGPTEIFGYSAQSTEHPHIFWIPGSNFPSTLGKKASTSDLVNFITVSLSAATVKTDLANQGALLYTQRGLCALERRIRKLALTAVKSQPEALAITLLEKPGYSAYLAGATVAIHECDKVEVSYYQLESCYRDVPVRVYPKNITAFIDVPTMTIRWESSSLSCNDPSIPILRLGSLYYKFSPSPTLVPISGPLPSLTEIPSLENKFHEKRLYESAILRRDLDQTVYIHRSKEAQLQLEHKIDPAIGTQGDEKRSWARRVSDDIGAIMTSLVVFVWLILLTGIVLKNSGFTPLILLLKVLSLCCSQSRIRKARLDAVEELQDSSSPLNPDVELGRSSDGERLSPLPREFPKFDSVLS
eukprot:TRINITY_DN7242_c0_g1_i1.p1 TRINITY_DN7242_c0_g1~~TRINITY_DN7242_c0_g1_i1.p1  ORF type:complete len:617 (-),score=-39.62 TRINITY_DN7242_c0_g1_i1:354-2204(-)